MAAALLRPDLPVVARTVSPAIGERMHAFGTPSVVNPFDRFGDHLRLALNAPASYQLLTWLEAGPGAELPEPGQAAARRPLGDVRLRALRSRADRRPAGGGARGHHHRAGRPPASRSQGSSSATRPSRERAGAGRPGERPSGSSPAPTTTPPTCPCSPRPPDEPGPVPGGPAEPPDQRAAVRGDARRRPAGADRGGRPRGVRADQHAAAVALHPGACRRRATSGRTSSSRRCGATAAVELPALWKVKLDRPRRPPWAAGSPTAAGLARRSAPQPGGPGASARGRAAAAAPRAAKPS